MGIRAKQVDFLLGGLEHQDALLVGGKVYFYEPGTTNLATIYGNANKSTVAQNPVVLNAQASAEIFLDGIYDVRIEDSSGALVNTIDGVDYQVNPAQGKTPVNAATTYNAKTTNLAIYCATSGGSLTVNLPTAVGRLGEEITVTKTTGDANTVTVDPAGAETINGAATHALTTGWEYITMASDGTNWAIVGQSSASYPDGTAALPSITFTNDPDTGWFRKAANQIGAAIGGVLAGFFASTGWNGNVVGDVAGNVTGNLTGNSTGSHTGPVVGNLTGNSTGSHTGPVVGNLTGNASGSSGSCTGNAATATKLLTARTIDGQSFDGSGNITVIAPGTHAAAGKSTPADADELPLIDSAASFSLKALTFANLKATIKSHLDSFYLALTGDQTIAGTKTFSSTIQASISGNADTVDGIHFIKGSTTWNIGVMNSGATASTTMTVTGAVAGDVCLLCFEPITALQPFPIFTAFVSAPNTVTLWAYHAGSNAINMTANHVFRVVIAK